MDFALIDRVRDFVREDTGRQARYQFLNLLCESPAEQSTDFPRTQEGKGL